MELGRRGARASVKKLLHPITSTYPTGQMELGRRVARASVKKLLHPITSGMELGRRGASLYMELEKKSQFPPPNSEAVPLKPKT